MISTLETLEAANKPTVRLELRAIRGANGEKIFHQKYVYTEVSCFIRCKASVLFL